MSAAGSAGVLRELLDESRDGLLTLDENGTIRFANDAAGVMLGRTKHYLVGKPLAAFVPLDDRRRFRHALTEVVERGAASVSLHLHDGDSELAIVLRRRERTSPSLVTVALRVDGSEAPLLRPLPHERQISRELDTFFLRFPHAVIGVDRALRVAFANPRARTLLTWNLVQQGRPFVDGPAEGRLRALAERLVTIAAPIPATLVTLADERVLRVSGIAARALDPAVMLIEDVTEETRSDRVMRDFVRNAAHQLRTPLTAIAGATQVLQAGAKENPAERDRFLEHIDRHTTRLTRIARGLLSLARAQSGEPLRLDFAELSPLLEELAREAEPADEVTIEVSCASDLAALCEPDLLREALAALVDNAVDHTQAGTVHLAATEEAGRVTVEVADTGSGILPEHRGRLFEPFYRPQASGNGFGLGLAIASQAVEAMGGTLEIAEAEVGSRFTIRLPSARVVT